MAIAVTLIISIVIFPFMVDIIHRPSKSKIEKYNV